MSILVCGGAGYIGSHTVLRLIEKGYDVVVIDNLQTGHKLSIHQKARFYEGDLRDCKFLNEVVKKEKIDGVIHLAANSLVGESMGNPYTYYENNVYGTLQLLKVLQESQINRVVFSSTAAVYGEPTQLPILETDQTIPESPYGETKLAMEKIFKWFDCAHGIKYVALRYFNVAGSYGTIGEDHQPETHLIPLIQQVPLGIKDSLSIYGSDYGTPDGTCIRDYIHVIDVADAHILALEHLFKGGESAIYNLGSGRGFSVKEIIETARRVTGHPIPTLVKERRPGDPAILIASNEKAIKELGWKIQYGDIETIIRSSWDWYQKHPKGYGDRND